MFTEKLMGKSRLMWMTKNNVLALRKQLQNFTEPPLNKVEIGISNVP